MEKTETEIHDFMNVDSFSQLPFIRPAQLAKEKGIRLFGKEFGGDSSSAAFVAVESDSNETNARDDTKENDNNGESSRKFECHYCCRNFPTSQALGGHQNAHKRERQHAKRAHLQSAMAQHGAYPEAHVYGIMNYHRFGSAPSPTAMSYNHSWSTNTNAYGTSNGRFYGSYSQPPPINGSPLGLWRIPSVHSSASSSNFGHQERLVSPLPLFANEELKTTSTSSPSVLIGGSGSQQRRYVYESKQPSVKDHVSLDLRL